MATIEGIGGVFIESEDAPLLAQWYEEKLGIVMEAHPDNDGFFHIFWTRDSESGVLRESPVFAINPARGSLPDGDRGFVLNLRVDDLDALLARLRGQEVAIEDRILVWQRGKHGWIRDLDGNRVELYEEIFVKDS